MKVLIVISDPFYGSARVPLYSRLRSAQACNATLAHWCSISLTLDLSHSLFSLDDTSELEPRFEIKIAAYSAFE